MMEIEEPFKVGFLLMPPQSFLRKTWPKRFCALYNNSSHGIQRLEVFDNDSAFLKHSPSRIVLLTDCIKVTPTPQKHQANVFEVRTVGACHQFSAESFQDMTEWLAALQTVAFGAVRPSSVGNINQCITEDIKQEENLLYSSMDEPQVYCVKALNTDGMVRNSLHGDYKLVITPVSISVAEEKPQNKVGRTILTWPYRHIRRYGCSKDNFSFEAGRKCVSGEGLFAFHTTDGRSIFQSVDAHVASLKSSQTDSDGPGSPFPNAENCSVFTYTTDNLNDKTTVKSCSSDSPNKELNSHLKTNISGKDSVKPAQILKPPRKSKQNTYINVKVNDDDNKQTEHLCGKSDGAVLRNVYDMPHSCDINYSKCEIVSDNSKASEMQILPSDVASSEPIYAVLEENSINAFNLTALSDEIQQNPLSSHTRDLPNFNKCEKVIHRKYPNRDSDCYDHLSLKNTRTAVLNRSPDHVYGKLMPTRPSSATMKLQSDNDGSIFKLQGRNVFIKDMPDNNHSYTNVLVPKSTSSPTDKKPTEVLTEPPHFLRNNAEYAKVFKNKK